jgi:hypothetical protein
VVVDTQLLYIEIIEVYNMSYTHVRDLLILVEVCHHKTAFKAEGVLNSGEGRPFQWWFQKAT